MRHFRLAILLTAIALVLASYAQYVISPAYINAWTLVAFWVIVFYVGTIVLCEEITNHLEGTSLVRDIFRSRRNLLGFLIAGTLGGIMLDGIAQWLGKLWIYPYWTNTFYAGIFILGFSAYWLCIAESYLAAKAVLKQFWKKEVRGYFRFERWLYPTLGILGIFLLITGIWFLITRYQQGYVFMITEPFIIREGLAGALVVFLGIWFLLEFIEYVQHKTSLLKDIMHGYGVPFLAILLASVALSVFMETVNHPYGLWRYTNWPFPEAQILGMPLLIFIIWPLHYIGFLSLFRVITDKESKEIWR